MDIPFVTDRISLQSPDKKSKLDNVSRHETVFFSLPFTAKSKRLNKYRSSAIICVASRATAITETVEIKHTHTHKTKKNKRERNDCETQKKRRRIRIMKTFHKRHAAVIYRWFQTYPTVKTILGRCFFFCFFNIFRTKCISKTDIVTRPPSSCRVIHAGIDKRHVHEQDRSNLFLGCTQLDVLFLFLSSSLFSICGEMTMKIFSPGFILLFLPLCEILRL